MNGKEFLRFASQAGMFAFRSEQGGQSSMPSRAEELLENGYGLVILFNHFSTRDSLHVIDFVFKNPVMRKKAVLAPMAFHMYKRCFEPPGKVLNISLCPIVTEDTIEAWNRKGYSPLNSAQIEKLRMEYFQKAVVTLQNGGIIIVGPQTGRKEFLGDPERPTIGTLIAQADRKNLDNFAFLFVGLGIKGAEDYKKEHVGGLNPFKTYQVNIGPTFTKEEVMEAVNGSYREVDKLVFEQLGKLVSPAYKTSNTLGIR